MTLEDVLNKLESVRDLAPTVKDLVNKTISCARDFDKDQYNKETYLKLMRMFGDLCNKLDIDGHIELSEGINELIEDIRGECEEMFGEIYEI